MFKLTGSNKTAYNKGYDDFKNGKYKNPYTFLANRMMENWWNVGQTDAISGKERRE